MNKFIIGLLVLVIGGAVGWYYFGGATKLPGMNIGNRISPAPTVASGDVEISQETPVSGTEKGGVSGKVVVTYTDNGFVPATITITKGETVTFRNENAGGMWVASDAHPTHQLLPGFDQKKSVVNGGEYTYTFTKIGTWKYHNHVKPTDSAVVVVME